MDPGDIRSQCFSYVKGQYEIKVSHTSNSAKQPSALNVKDTFLTEQGNIYSQ